MTAPNRIFKVTYVGAGCHHGCHRPRKAETLVKVPYGGVFGMTELLTRMLTVGQIRWFRVEPAKTISDAERKSLERWMPALMNTSEVTAVDWTA